MTQHDAGNGLSDQLLVARCQADDLRAFDLLVDRYQSRVFGFVRRMIGDAQEAEDVAQEVFVRAFRNIRRYDGRASVAGWLFKIATNLCIDRRRRRSRRVAEVPFEAESDFVLGLVSPTGNPQEEAVAKQMYECVQSGLETLSERLRAVILLHDVEGMGYEEIATTLNIPVGTVKSRLFLARERLRLALATYLQTGETHG